MDWTPLEHAGITAVLQIAGGLLFNDWMIGGILGVGFFLGREHSQAEFRYISAHGGKRSDMPYFAGFYPSAWDVASVMDLVAPVITVTSVALVFRYFK